MHLIQCKIYTSTAINTALVCLFSTWPWHQPQPNIQTSRVKHSQDTCLETHKRTNPVTAATDLPSELALHESWLHPIFPFLSCFHSKRIHLVRIWKYSRRLGGNRNIIRFTIDMVIALLLSQLLLHCLITLHIKACCTTGRHKQTRLLQKRTHDQALLL